MRSRKPIWSAAIGLLLSTLAQGCSHPAVELPVDKPVPVAVAVKDPPPSDLLACAQRPAGLPVDQVATIPAVTRAALIGVAGALAANAAQLDRLINWIAPGSCPMVPAP